ncbi:MAG: Mur ligase family protein, partial [Pseudomonadota bacterium]
MAEGKVVKELEELGLLIGAKRAGRWRDKAALTGLAVDSRAVKPGHLFFALPGTKLHGGEFVQYALRMGAAAVVTDTEGAALAERDCGAIEVPVVVHPDPRLALAVAARRWFGEQPGTMVAVTGTNGKTSVASFTRQIWEQLGAAAVNFGTTGVEGVVAAPLSHTTPEPITLHRLLADLVEQGVSHAAMEASSHGLDQKRLDGVRLRAAAFTNISRDHLDYHADFESYFQAKAGLFTRVLPKDGVAVINTDDPSGARLKTMAKARGQRVISVGS